MISIINMTKFCLTTLIKSC